jgi:hypothetical protein
MHEWKIFFDLQCPFSKRLRQLLPAIKARYGPMGFKITTHIISLAFHRQSFPAHCVAYLVGIEKGNDCRLRFEEACYDNLDLYVDEAVTSMTKAEVNEVFASIAEKAGVFDDTFSKEMFVQSLQDHNRVIMPTWFEHKQALMLGVFKAPQHVLNGVLIPDTDSSWSVDDYEPVLKKHLENYPEV